MIEASCHCGEVKIEIDGDIPNALTSCNCSICRRYGSLMAYYSPSKVAIKAKPESLQKYVWGDKLLAFVRCSQCGCFTHWEGFDPATDRMGINARLFENVDINQIRIRHFDGADTWKYLD